MSHPAPLHPSRLRLFARPLCLVLTLALLLLASFTPLTAADLPAGKLDAAKIESLQHELTGFNKAQGNKTLTTNTQNRSGALLDDAMVESLRREIAELDKRIKKNALPPAGSDQANSTQPFTAVGKQLSIQGRFMVGIEERVAKLERQNAELLARLARAEEALRAATAASTQK